MLSSYPFWFKKKAINLVTLGRKSITHVSLKLSLLKCTLYYGLKHQGPSSIALRIGGHPWIPPGRSNDFAQIFQARGANFLRATSSQSTNT